MMQVPSFERKLNSTVGKKPWLRVALRGVSSPAAPASLGCGIMPRRAVPDQVSSDVTETGLRRGERKGAKGGERERDWRDVGVGSVDGDG